MVIHIFSDMPVDEEHVKQAIRDHCAQMRKNNRREMMIETFREISLGILGLVFLSLWFFLSATHDSIWMEVLSIMGWVAVWEATSIAIMRRPELYHVNKLYDHASKAQIVIDVVEDTAA